VYFTTGSIAIVFVRIARAGTDILIGIVLLATAATLARKASGDTKRDQHQDPHQDGANSRFVVTCIGKQLVLGTLTIVGIVTSELVMKIGPTDGTIGRQATIDRTAIGCPRVKATELAAALRIVVGDFGGARFFAIIVLDSIDQAIGLSKQHKIGAAGIAVAQALVEHEGTRLSVDKVDAIEQLDQFQAPCFHRIVGESKAIRIARHVVRGVALLFVPHVDVDQGIIVFERGVGVALDVEQVTVAIGVGRVEVDREGTTEFGQTTSGRIEAIGIVGRQRKNTGSVVLGHGG